MRGVAALAGIPLKTLQGWINRGCAHPDEEPWGSFAVEYLAAERGLELSCAIPIAHWVNTMCTIAQQEQKTGVKGKTALSRGDVLLLDELRRNRFPKDHGASAHRVPEADPDPDGYLQQRALTQEQLTAMFAAPPEEIQAAMEAAGYVKVEKE